MSASDEEKRGHISPDGQVELEESDLDRVAGGSGLKVPPSIIAKVPPAPLQSQGIIQKSP